MPPSGAARKILLSTAKPKWKRIGGLWGVEVKLIYKLMNTTSRSCEPNFGQIHDLSPKILTRHLQDPAFGTS